MTSLIIDCAPCDITFTSGCFGFDGACPSFCISILLVFASAAKAPKFGSRVLTIPKEIVLKRKKSVLHNKNLKILNKFINEINNSSAGWTKENYLKYLKKYDETYPTKTNKTNKAEKVYKWRADFAIEWFMSLKEEGIINPIFYYIDRKPDTEIKKARWEFDGRGTHRPYLIAHAGYDVPYLLRVDEDKNPIYYSNKKDYPQLLNINLKSKTIKAYYSKTRYDEICY